VVTAGTGSYVAAEPSGLSYWQQGSATLSDVHSLVTDAVQDHDALASAFDAGGAALDLLGDIGDPLGAALGCAVGWIIDHVSFLRDPVNELAGDPESIQASIDTWANVSSGMQHDAQQLNAAVASLGAQTWSGAAADAYRARAGDLVNALGGSATMAELESALIAATGGLCAGVRATIFQAIAEALERWLIAGLIALANSAWTFGASLAGWVIDVEIDAGLLATRIGAKIAELIEKAGRIAETLGRDGSRLEQLGQRLTRIAEDMMHDVRSSRSRFGWDRRWSRVDRTGHAAADGKHLATDLAGAKPISHVGAASAVVQGGGAAIEEGVDPSQQHLDELAREGAQTSAETAGDKAVESVTGD
jgi:uncharacterized protein YukE